MVLDFSLGGDTYVVGNLIDKTNVQSSTACAGACANVAFVYYRSQTDNQLSGSYPEPYDDFHFVNNTAIEG